MEEDPLTVTVIGKGVDPSNSMFCRKARLLLNYSMSLAGGVTDMFPAMSCSSWMYLA